MTMSNETNMTMQLVDDTSKIFLRSQRPGYIFCISVCAADIASGVFFLLVGKYPVDITTHFYIKCSVIWEISSSFIYGISNIVHLQHSLTGTSEATTMWRCFATFGSISYFFILASDYFSALVSIDRCVSLFQPLIYKEIDKFRHLIFAIIVILLFTIFICGIIFDVYDETTLIPICMPRTGAGEYLNLFFNYSYTVSTVIPFIIYCSMVVYLFAQSHNCFISTQIESSGSNNLNELRSKMRDHVFKALMFNMFWRLMTNVVVNISAWLSVRTPYRGSLMGIYFAPLYFTNGCGILISYTLFVKKFRTNLISILKKEKSVSPVVAIKVHGNSVSPLAYNMPHNTSNVSKFRNHYAKDEN